MNGTREFRADVRSIDAAHVNVQMIQHGIVTFQPEMFLYFIGGLLDTFHEAGDPVGGLMLNGGANPLFGCHVHGISFS
jgi:hypothetical protein